MTKASTNRCTQPIVAGATPDERDPTHWPPEALEPLQRLLDRSRTRAGQAVRDTFERPERQMTALDIAITRIYAMKAREQW